MFINDKSKDINRDGDAKTNVRCWGSNLDGQLEVPIKHQYDQIRRYQQGLNNVIDQDQQILVDENLKSIEKNLDDILKKIPGFKGYKFSKLEPKPEPVDINTHINLDLM